MKHWGPLFFGAVLLLPPTHPALGASVSAPFSGLDKLHVAYDAYADNSSIPPGSTYLKDIRLELIGSSKGTQTLTSAAVPPEGSVHFSGTIIADSLSVDSYILRIVVKDSLNVESEWATAPAQVEANRMSGTLLFNETVPEQEDAIFCQSVVIPDGLDLDLVGNSYSGGSIDVHGTVQLDAAKLDAPGPLWIGYANPIQLSAPPNASYALRGAGSAISGGSDIHVIAADATLANIRQLTLEMEYGTGTVHVTNCTVEMNPWNLLASTELLCENCVLPSGFINIRDGDNLKFLNCVFPSSPRIDLSRSGGTALFQDCFFQSLVNIEGSGDCDCTFKDCEFSHIVWLDERTKPVFQNNRFLNYFYFNGSSWITADSPSPVIENNSFMGKVAIQIPLYGQKPAARVQIGSNYYGDKEGPTLVYSDVGLDRSFLGNRGSEIMMGFRSQEVGPLFEVAPPIESGPGPRKDLTVPPSVWVIDSLIGQNTLSHTTMYGPIRAGLDWLFCADIGCSEPILSGAEIYLEVNGQRVDSTRPRADLHRDLSDYGDESNLIRAQSTTNFIVPAMDETVQSIKLMADLSGVKGGGNKAPPLTLQEFGFYGTAPEPERRLNIIVQPVRLYLYGFTETPAPAASAFIQDLSNYMPAMFPLSESDIHFVSAAPITYTGVISNFAWIGTYSLISGLAGFLGSTRTLWNVASWASDLPGTQIDFVVGLVPHNGLGQGIDGANTAINRGVLLVDANKPTASLHEMGHGIGLYTGTEQYDEHPPEGVGVRGVTLFQTEEGYVPGFSGDRGRIRHMPFSTSSRFADQGWIDLMGSQDVPVWPISSTLSSFRSNFQARLNVPKAGTVTEKAELPMGMRTLFVQAMVEKIGEGTEEVHYRFVPGTLHAAPIDRGNQSYFEVADPPQQIQGRYEFRGFADDGNRYDYQAFQLIPHFGPSQERYDLWWATFVIANSVVNRYEIASVETGELVLEYLPGGSVDNELILPEPGATLERNTEIVWQASSSPSPLKRTGPAPPLTHHVLVSQDGGTTWQGVAGCIDDACLDLVTDFLPAGDDISIRVLSTDGLLTAESRIDNLRIENRPPDLRILSPLDGDQAEVGYEWSLSGSGYDLDDQVTVEGWWTSSLDGPIGTGNHLSGAVLSPGIHEIVFHATDSHSAEGTASIQVTVSENLLHDFSFAEDSLRLRGPSSNPSHPGITDLQVGSVHGADLSLRTDGAGTDVGLRLYLQSPSKAEVLLASRSFPLAPFDSAILSATFEVTLEGTHTLRGEVEVPGGSDTNPGNNQRAWDFPASLQLPTATPWPTLPPVSTPTASPTSSPTPEATPTLTPGEPDYDLDGNQILDAFDLLAFSLDWKNHAPPGGSIPGDFNSSAGCDAGDLLMLLDALD
jgi:hypothetical protein